MMATDAYGLDDVSLLSGPAQQTAKQVQQAFENSLKGAGRQAQRYGLPYLANFNEDAALARAQTAAGLINSNQQQQNAIDALNHTPHGFAENFAKYAPYLGTANWLGPTLFGKNAYSDSGLFGLAGKGASALGKGWDSIMHPAGSQWQIGPNGEILDYTGKAVTPYFDDFYNSPGVNYFGGGNDFIGSFGVDNIGSDWASGLFGG